MHRLAQPGPQGLEPLEALAKAHHHQRVQVELAEQERQAQKGPEVLPEQLARSVPQHFQQELSGVHP